MRKVCWRVKAANVALDVTLDRQGCVFEEVKKRGGLRGPKGQVANGGKTRASIRILYWGGGNDNVLG